MKPGRHNPCFDDWDAKTLLHILCQDCPEAVCIVDADKCFSYVNERMALRFGYEFADLCGQHVELVLPDEERDAALERLDALLRGEMAVFPRVTQLVTRQGALLPMQIVARPLVTDRGARHVIATLVDMTPVLRLERLREEAERVVRHDMRSPLTALMGFAASLLRDESLQEAQRAKVQYIQEIGQKLNYLLQHSMDLFRMEEGTYTLTPAPCNLLHALQNILAETGHLAQRKGIQVQVLRGGAPLQPGGELMLEGDELLLQSMLANLLLNALEASPEGTQVRVQLREEQGRVHLEIANQGEVPVEIRDRFFQKYATAGKPSGTGLGAYSARLVARAHGGDIAMQTGAQGTRITVTLPLQQPRNQEGQ